MTSDQYSPLNVLSVEQGAIHDLIADECDLVNVPLTEIVVFPVDEDRLARRISRQL